MHDRHGKFDQEFEKLMEYINHEVTCVYVRKNFDSTSTQKYQGILKDVQAYDFINIDGNLISFVGVIDAIVYIFSDENNFAIFENPNVANYKGTKRQDIMSLINSQNEYLGFSVAMEEMQKGRTR